MPGSLVALLQAAYLAAGLLLVAAYVPQLRRAWCEPQATARAWSPGSLLTWALCRLVAWAYVALVARDGLLTLVVGLDAAGRVAMLVMLLRARGAAGALPAVAPLQAAGAPWRCVVVLALAALLVACRSAHPGTPAPAMPPGPPPADLAAARAHVLNHLLLPLIEAGTPLVWADPALAYDCPTPPRIEVDGQPLQPGAALPARAFTLDWSAQGCALALQSAEPLSGAARLQVFHDGEAYSAIVTTRGLQLPGASGPVRLQGSFSAATGLVPDDRP